MKVLLKLINQESSKKVKQFAKKYDILNESDNIKKIDFENK